MVLVEELDSPEVAVCPSRDDAHAAFPSGGDVPPFAQWLRGCLARGTPALELMKAIGVGDDASGKFQEGEALQRLHLFASHPHTSTKACEVVRKQSLQLSKLPPIPFATWLLERWANKATAEQVLRVLNMTPSAGATIDDKTRWEGLWQLAQQENAWEIVADMAKKPGMKEAPPRARIFKFEGEAAVAERIAKSRRIFVLAGAGISVACGLPTYRDDDQRGAIAREFGLSKAEEVSDIATFQQNPLPWFRWIRDLVPSTGRQRVPSLTHRFLRALEDRGKLLRLYTQNIDTLENVAGISQLVHCHGSFATATCVRCSQQLDNATPVNDAIAAGSVPRCPACQEGVMKPDVTMFGEPMPPGVMQGLNEDTDAADLLLVIGTSLQVTPCSLVPSLVGASGDAPRVLINRELVGRESDFECYLPGACDEVVAKLAQHLGWEL